MRKQRGYDISRPETSKMACIEGGSMTDTLKVDVAMITQEMWDQRSC